MRHTLLSCFFALSSVLFASTPQAQPSTYDLIIRGGRVLDGTGNPWIRADVAIRGDRIVTVGRLTGAVATRVIDARDNVVAPGFIDVHSHAAGSLSHPTLRQAQPLLAQGVTTIVANPDGGGPVDLASQTAKLQSAGIGVNVALLIGHGSVRRAVLGSAERAPTDSELDAMRALVQKGMDAGAFGLSSGLFYAPASFASTEEVIALARVAAASGGVYTSHIRDESNYGIGLLAAVQEVIRIADEAGLTGIVSHMKALGPETWGLATAVTMRIDAARRRGVSVFADQYPYEASSTSLRAALAPGGRPPTEPIVRENLRRRGGPTSIVIAFYKADRTLEGKSLEQIAMARGVTPEAAAIDLLARGEASIVSFNMSEVDIRHIMTRPYTMASSDGDLVLPAEGKPHPRNNGAFARRLGLYVRERQVVSLEFAVRSMTSLPATVFGIRDRGVVRDGAIADVVVFDPERIRDTATYAEPHGLAEGTSQVVVNGVVVLEGGRLTGALAGKVLRK